MTNEKLYKIDEVCEQIQVSIHTLTKWYQWEKYALKDGSIDKPYLPQPSKLENSKGRPKVWTEEQINQLREFKGTIIVGRNGKFGRYSNPSHKGEN